MPRYVPPADGGVGRGGGVERQHALELGEFVGEQGALGGIPGGSLGDGLGGDDVSDAGVGEALLASDPEKTTRRPTRPRAPS